MAHLYVIIAQSKYIDGKKNITSEHQREYATRVTNGSLELLYDLLSVNVLQYQIPFLMRTNLLLQYVE